MTNLKTQETGKTILSTKTLPNEWSTLGRVKQDAGLTLQIYNEDRTEAKAEKAAKAAKKAKIKKTRKIYSTFFRNRRRGI